MIFSYKALLSLLLAFFPLRLVFAVTKCASSKTYVRWGKTTCPDSDEVVYVGFTAGSAHNQGGSGANPKCLTLDPATRNIHTQSQDGALMYPFFYATASYGIEQFKHLQDGQIPCVMCYNAMPQFMLPGSVECPENFERSYFGWLMSAHNTHTESNFICVDDEAESTGGGGQPLYPVESEEIPQYLHDVEVVCSVCRATSPGSMFIRWGKSECPIDSAPIYTGTATSKHAGQTGSGANILCFYDQPVYGVGGNSGNHDGGLLFTMEYEVVDYGDQWSNALQNFDIPCTFCQHSVANSAVMVTGRADCPKDFSLDYNGTLMANAQDVPRTEHICVDRYSEPQGTDTDNNWAPLRRVEVGTPLPSPKYTFGREITCSHCSSRKANEVYTVWGRRKCPESATELYRGTIAGSANNVDGGGYNYVCAHEDPQETGSPISEGGPFLYQVEYETSTYGINDFKPLHDHEAPCAVCQTASALAITEIAGSYKCPDGWTAEYSGYLMASHYSHAGKSQYLCVHENAETSEFSSSSSNDGGLLYPTEIESTVNGYITDYELSCAVCSKLPSDADSDFMLHPDAENFGSISGLIWFDANKDGIRDTGEQGIPEVTLDLNDLSDDSDVTALDGITVASTNTSSLGEFEFPHIEAFRTYKILITDNENKLEALALTSGDSPYWIGYIENDGQEIVDFGFASDCTDQVEDWHDINDWGCDSYKDHPVLCAIADSLANNEESAADICCACDGGLDACFDIPDWQDSEGYTCDLYASYIVLCDFSEMYQSDLSASNACCSCGGGVREFPEPVNNSKTETEI